MSTETVTHNSDAYTFDSESTSDAVVEYLSEGPLSYPYQCYYEFELRNAHNGPPIRVRMVDPTYDFGTDGAFCPTWSKLLFADDGTEVTDAWVLDFYSEVLSDELGEIIKETWD